MKEKKQLIFVEEFETSLFRHLLKRYKKEIQDEYDMDGLAKMDDKWVVRLRHNPFKKILTK